MDDVLSQGLATGLGVANKPANKHCSITQVKNGFIVYAGADTFVSYTFEELVEHLKTAFSAGV